MDWHKISSFLNGLPEWQRVAGALLFFIGLLVFGIRWVFAWVLVAVEDTRLGILAEKQKKTAGTPYVSEEETLSRSCIPSWLVKSARKYERLATRLKK